MYQSSTSNFYEHLYKLLNEYRSIQVNIYQFIYWVSYVFSMSPNAYLDLDMNEFISNYIIAFYVNVTIVFS